MDRHITLVTVLTGLLALAPAALGAGEPVSAASPMQQASDPVMGDWQGQLTTGAEVQPLCIQVIALGAGNYQANLLSAFDKRAPVVAALSGKAAETGVAFTGTQASGVEAATWSGLIKEGVFTGRIEGTTAGTFEAKPVTRLSPTLGAPAPEGAVVLFDGSNLDGWEHPPAKPQAIDLGGTLGGAQCVAYLRGLVWSPEEQDVSFELGSDDGIKAWVNKQLVHANNAQRALKPGEDKAAVHLVRGWNVVLLKVTQVSGDWGVAARLRKPDGGPLPGLQVARNSVPFEATRAADPTPETAVSADDSDGYLLQWQVSGPYRQDGAEAAALFDIAYPPEESGESEWRPMPIPETGPQPCRWLLLDNGAAEVRGGNIVSKRLFKDHRIHLEFRLPFMPDERGQGRANSGVYVQGRYEVQVLDSYGLEGRDNECGGLYKLAAPEVNMCAPPLQWQTYDITFHAPRFDASGKKVKEAALTVVHNGVPIQENLTLPGPTPGGLYRDDDTPGGLLLQDHGNPVWFRNIWAVELPETPQG